MDCIVDGLPCCIDGPAPLNHRDALGRVMAPTTSQNIITIANAYMIIGASRRMML